MKKILFAALLIATLHTQAEQPKKTTTTQTKVSEGQNFVILETTDEKTIDCLEQTNEVYLIFSIVTENTDGTRTGKYFYEKKHLAYVVKRAADIEKI